MSELASNAKKRGDKAEALRWYREAFEKSEGPATRLQWGASYVSALVDLAPADEAAIEATDRAALARGGGPARRVLRAQRPLAAEGRRQAAGLEQGRRAPRRDGAAAGQARHAVRRAGAQRRASARPARRCSRRRPRRAPERRAQRAASSWHRPDRRRDRAARDRAPDGALRRDAGRRRRLVRRSPPGEKFALVGESGSGKSITALSVLGLVDGATHDRARSASTASDLLRQERARRCAASAAARSR